MHQIVESGNLSRDPFGCYSASSELFGCGGRRLKEETRVWVERKRTKFSVFGASSLLFYSLLFCPSLLFSSLLFLFCSLSLLLSSLSCLLFSSLLLPSDLPSSSPFSLPLS